MGCRRSRSGATFFNYRISEAPLGARDCRRQISRAAKFRGSECYEIYFIRFFLPPLFGTLRHARGRLAE